MKGSSRYRDGAWRLTVQNGPRRIYKTVHAPNNRTGEGRADEVLAQMVTEVRAGRHQADERLTVAELLDKWIKRGAPDWSPSTLATNRQQARDHVAAHIGHLYLDQVRPSTIDDLYADLRSRLAGSTVDRIHSSVLQPALNRAVRLQLIATNPADGYDPPDRDDEEVVPPSVDNVRALIGHAATPEFATYLRIAASIGARRGTLSALRWSTVDLDAGSVRFERANTVGDGGLTEKANKGRRSFAAVLSAGDVKILTTHRARMLERAMSVGARLGARSYVWSNASNCSTAWWPTSISRSFAATRTAAGLPQVKLHHLKHFAITQMLANGITTREVAQRTGTTTATIERVYAHWIPGGDARAAAVMDRLLG